MNFKEYSFLDKSILIKFPDSWIVKEQHDNLVKVSDPFGPYPTLDCYVSCFDKHKINRNNKIISIKEKPKKFLSDLAITGLYFFDNKVVEYAKKLKPSKRGEVEIVDLLNFYKNKNQLSADLIGRGGAWLDTGSIEDFYKTSAFRI